MKFEWIFHVFIKRKGKKKKKTIQRSKSRKRFCKLEREDCFVLSNVKKNYGFDISIRRFNKIKKIKIKKERETG